MDINIYIGSPNVTIIFWETDITDLQQELLIISMLLWYNDELESDFIPSIYNTSGTYCFKEPSSPELRKYRYYNNLVLLALSGTVVETENGYRAQHAQIVRTL